MEKPVYPCDSCTAHEQYRCKRCPRWRRWYQYRQDLINEYARKVETHWLYRLPLRRIRKEP